MKCEEKKHYVFNFIIVDVIVIVHNIVVIINDNHEFWVDVQWDAMNKKLCQIFQGTIFH